MMIAESEEALQQDEGQMAEDKGNEDWKKERCVQCGS